MRVITLYVRGICGRESAADLKFVNLTEGPNLMHVDHWSGVGSGGIRRY